MFLKISSHAVFFSPLYIHGFSQSWWDTTCPQILRDHWWSIFYKSWLCQTCWISTWAVYGEISGLLVRSFWTIGCAIPPKFRFHFIEKKRGWELVLAWTTHWQAFEWIESWIDSEDSGLQVHRDWRWRSSWSCDALVTSMICLRVWALRKTSTSTSSTMSSIRRCPTCNVIFPTIDVLNDHYRLTSHIPLAYSCEPCQRAFQTLSGLQNVSLSVLSSQSSC